VSGTTTTLTAGSGTTGAGSGDGNYPGSVGDGGAARANGQDGYMHLEWGF
jgi:hypothetical protein